MTGASDTIIGCYGYGACMNASMDNQRDFYSYAGNRCRSRSACLGATRISGTTDQAGRGEGFLSMQGKKVASCLVCFLNDFAGFLLLLLFWNITKQTNKISNR